MIRTKYKVLKLEDIAVNSKNAIVDGPFGSALKVKDYVDDGIPVLQGKNISNFQFNFSDIRYITPQKAQELIRSKVEVGDILFVKIGSIGYSAEVTDLNGYPFAIIPANLAKVSIDYSKVDKNYLLFWLRSDTVVNYLKKNASKTAQPALSLGKIKQIPVVMPSLETQKKISAVLLKAQELIDKRKAQIEALDQLTQSVFLEMFGDPVTNKTWERRPLKDIADVRDGTHDSPKYVPNGYPLVTSKNIKNGKIDLSNVNYISEEDFININKRSKVDVGDIIMPMIGTIGNPIIVDEQPNFAIKNVALIKFNNPLVVNIYLKYLLDSHYLDYILNKNKRGGTQKFLSLTDIRNMEIPLPPRDLQDKFSEIVKKIDSQKSILHKSLRELEKKFQLPHAKGV
ncbi:restriction endonuclease subunit S [Geobacillus sp. WSUCF1]|uniref:restriction endonuclease subunit S n=1 Tax=Geobacillus sp. WSUCF1 TaxID=886559 RepID=UPI00035899E1|nr:restriction endonuclease subunit S [Geobacillus sp. WSUCF1]EPR28581.1 Type I restriction-modification system restriction subunit [Geobacillus sp. WSUCF1]